MIKLFREALSCLVDALLEKNYDEYRSFLDVEIEITVLDLNFKKTENYTGNVIRLFPVIENGHLLICSCPDSDELDPLILDDIKSRVKKSMMLLIRTHAVSPDIDYRDLDFMKTKIYLHLPNASDVNIIRKANCRISNFVFNKYFPKILYSHSL